MRIALGFFVAAIALSAAVWLQGGAKLERVTESCNPERLSGGIVSFASVMIDAGVNLKALSAYMGHSSMTITLDRYGHLLPGAEAEAASLLDAYLSSSSPIPSASTQ